MDVPNPGDLNEFNRLLLVVRSLSVEGVGCRASAVIAMCSSFVLGGGPADYRRIIGMCQRAGCIAMHRGLISLSNRGSAFLQLNSSQFYEITDGQRDLVARDFVLKGMWASKARALFQNFGPNYEKLTYELSLSGNALPARFNAVTQLLLALRVLRVEEGRLVVDSRYVANVRDLLASKRGMTEEELARALLAERKLGEQAEIVILEYERKRLAAQGRPEEARLARRISQLSVDAGYDIESFDGAGPAFDYDRFIEVKASYENALRFHWTENQRRVAERLADRYWIYFVGGFRPQFAVSVKPIMIRNPAERLPQIKQLIVQPAEYMVTQRDSLPLQPTGSGDCLGFEL